MLAKIEGGVLIFLINIVCSWFCRRASSDLEATKSSHSQSKRAPTLRAKELPLSEQKRSHSRSKRALISLSGSKHDCSVSESLPVVDVLAEALTHPLELSDVVRDLLDGLHLLLQVLGLDEVTQLSILVAPSNLVQVQQTLVDRLLQLQCHLHGLQAVTPLIIAGLLDVLQYNAASSLVLVRHQLLCVLTLLVRGSLEELGKPRQSYVITVKVQAH